MLSNGAYFIAAERQHQVETGKNSDESYANSELSKAAEAYLTELRVRKRVLGVSENPPSIWPWDAKHWLPTDEVAQLVKAGALIAAEIDRIIGEQHAKTIQTIGEATR